MSARLVRTTGPDGPVAKMQCHRRVPGSALLNEEQWAEIARALRLSGRELEIVRGVFDNHTEHAIAVDHGIADSTVHTHLHRLYEKLAVSTRVELVLRVMASVLHSTSSILPASSTETITARHGSSPQTARPGVH